MICVCVLSGAPREIVSLSFKSAHSTISRVLRVVLKQAMLVLTAVSKYKYLRLEGSVGTTMVSVSDIFRHKGRHIKTHPFTSNYTTSTSIPRENTQIVDSGMRNNIHCICLAR